MRLDVATITEALHGRVISYWEDGPEWGVRVAGAQAPCLAALGPIDLEISFEKDPCGDVLFILTDEVGVKAMDVSWRGVHVSDRGMRFHCAYQEDPPEDPTALPSVLERTESWDVIGG